ncbi:MAG: hypothetical protein NW214_11620 [Pseudanabaenaceae cyanobacterium bins.39]|nr:hypothetical protein [Pseudanabaenaceae cyanobacterium bins.39]
MNIQPVVFFMMSIMSFFYAFSGGAIATPIPLQTVNLEGLIVRKFVTEIRLRQHQIDRKEIPRIPPTISTTPY